MRVRFKGEADGLPCHAFGQEFPAGEWVTVEGAAALKLATNPMFDADGKPAKAKAAVIVEPEPEPDPEADADPAPNAEG